MNFQVLKQKNQSLLKNLNLPGWQPSGKVLIWDVESPSQGDYFEYVLPETTRYGLHGNFCAQIIRIVAGDAVKVYVTNSTDRKKILEFCIDNDVRVISASFGGGCEDQDGEFLKRYAEWGGFFVAAAGNTAGQPVQWPARSFYSIAVSSTYGDDNDGPEIDISADRGYWIESDGLYQDFEGTSCSTPVIAACILYILDLFPEMHLNQVRRYLQTFSTTGTEQYERVFKFPDYKNKEMVTVEHNAFIAAIAPGAQAAYKKYGVLPSLTIAQAILESAWGESAPGDNLFGIKWTQGCGYERQDLATTEYIDGKKVNLTDGFRKYSSYADSIDDHGKLFKLVRYKPVVDARDYKEACLEVQKCGYATDPSYASQLIAIIEQYGLTKYDKEVVRVPITNIQDAVKYLDEQVNLSQEDIDADYWIKSAGYVKNLDALFIKLANHLQGIR